MAKKQWIDLNGNEVPAQYVPKLDKDRERITLKHLKRAKKLSEQLERFKEELLADCDAVYEKMLADNNVPGNSKGGFSISTFDRDAKIEISVQERIEFDDLISVAHEKIKLYLEEKTQGVDHDLQQIINQAFETRKGRMDVKRILGLFRLKINHPTWMEAMELIKQSINRNNSKRYARVWEKDKNGEYRNIELNFSSI
ncbi:MAG TPA: DUF3164 family protein [Bacteroidales bacterium]|jgi:hypothetical protein|nr:DUF3164 family protein [Bacteroidales bacterium]